MQTLTEERYALDNAAYWARRADSYSAQHALALADGRARAWERELGGRLREAFPERGLEGLEVLDAGCGPGFFSVVLSRLGCRVTAVDYTASMLDEARRNARGCGVRFVRMDAQDLAFPDASFDAVVSRNLTWNLPRPQRAYEQWARVLRPGGLLLNYDANWYGYLHDEELRRRFRDDRGNAARLCARDVCLQGDPPAMERLAASAPLSRESRPEWDRRVLGALGMRVEVDRGVYERVWSREELVCQASTPLFGVIARR